MRRGKSCSTQIVAAIPSPLPPPPTTAWYLSAQQQEHVAMRLNCLSGHSSLLLVLTFVEAKEPEIYLRGHKSALLSDTR